MELALYHPQFGYYTRTTDKNGAEQIGAGQAGEDPIGPGRDCEDRIGWNGDFYTSSDVHPVMAQALARQSRQVDEALGHPDPFTVIEMGAGKGFLARDFLAACEQMPSDFFRRLRYVIVERSQAMKASQRQQLSRWTGASGTAAWRDALAQLEDGSLTGVLLSNELLDAFPVHRIFIEQG
ncbi:MAG: SAM-dependent methyltransferase, partial [Nitrospiraceae bacterium]